MPVETLSYETPQFLQKLLGHDLAGLRHIAEATGAQVTSREAWVRLEGGETEVRNAREVFIQLERLRRQGGEITPSMLKLVTESVLTAHDEAAPAEAVMTLRLAGSAKKPPVQSPSSLVIQRSPSLTRSRQTTAPSGRQS